MPENNITPEAPLPPLTDEQLKGAEDNLVRCLDAFRKDVRPGLEEVLLEMYPDKPLGKQNFRREKILGSSHVILGPPEGGQPKK